MLQTNLEHLETRASLMESLRKHENVMICCGRMGPMCLPVYAAMDNLRSEYPHVAFFDQDFDGPAAGYIQDLPECSAFMGLPFTVYFKNGKPVAATTSLQASHQVRSILDRHFGNKK
ncbi:MAG: thioredoxin [Verrucomicrobiota bacterium]